MNLVFDIETVGYEFNSLSESQQEYILRYAEQEKDELKREEKIEDAKRYLSLYPFTAKIVAIGMLNTETENVMVLYESKQKEEFKSEEKKATYKSMTEEEMIMYFWDCVKKVEKIITFNGKNFDVPFIILRSAVLKIKPSRNLIKSKYDTSNHIDLLEQFTFYGIIKKFNLDFYCHAFGIESPKSKGITGMEVKELYKAGRIKDIAVYCGEDVRATFELYKIWNEYLNFT
ncbi:MAG: ribonuclease H-like domain-containing protein [Melioribacter sp.]|uniref:ribonuclease H-like domain-containing protein n=1 Tax=Rosettibacter primus TaxID=3111523 RepID=UPI00247E4393|nr:ribonuclease H-like domain-containing protein [Melioribacter sp.]